MMLPLLLYTSSPVLRRFRLWDGDEPDLLLLVFEGLIRSMMLFPGGVAVVLLEGGWCSWVVVVVMVVDVSSRILGRTTLW